MALRSIERWNALKPDYRNRLIRRGITRERYLTGENLAVGRGHGKTPEHPGRATPARYPEYVGKRTGKPVHIPTDQELKRHFAETLVAGLMSGDVERIDITTFNQYLPLISPATRIEMMNADTDKWRELARYQQPKGQKRPAQKWFVKNGDHWENPFWYH